MVEFIAHAIVPYLRCIIYTLTGERNMPLPLCTRHRLLGIRLVYPWQVAAQACAGSGQTTLTYWHLEIKEDDSR